MGLPPQLVSWDLDCRQQLQCRREQRSFFSVRGLGGAQSSGLHGLSTLLYTCPCPLTYEGVDRIGVHHFHQFGRDHLRLPMLQVNYSRLKNFGKEYFADPTQWRDNRADKRDSRSPDFRDKVMRKALWIYGCSTPPWVKAMVYLIGEGKMHPRVAYDTKDSQDTTQEDRLSKGYNGRGCIVPSIGRESRHIVPGGGGGMSLKAARSTTEGYNLPSTFPPEWFFVSGGSGNEANDSTILMAMSSSNSS